MDRGIWKGYSRWGQSDMTEQLSTAQQSEKNNRRTCVKFLIHQLSSPLEKPTKILLTGLCLILKSITSVY